MLLNDGKNWEPDDDLVLKWKTHFRGKVDVDRELVKRSEERFSRNAETVQ